MLFPGARQAPSLLVFPRFSSAAFCVESLPVPPFSDSSEKLLFLHWDHNRFSGVKASHAGIPHAGVWSLLNGAGLMGERQRVAWGKSGADSW